MENFSNFKWANQSKIEIMDEQIIIKALPKSDFFCGGNTTVESGIFPETLCNAPFYYTEVKGDFIMHAKVQHKFQYVYDACALMVMESDDLWAKICLEKTDFNTHAVVSVVTNKISDDANGCNVDTDQLWLQVARSGNRFAFHYSLDGQKFDMVRFFYIPVSETIKVGMVAQSPTGEGGERIFENFSIKNVKINNLREAK